MSAPTSDYGVLVAVDGSASDAAVRWACREAADRDLPLTLMHVIAPVVVGWPVRYLQAGYRDWQENHAKQIIEHATKTAASDDSQPTVAIEVRHGVVAAELLAASQRARITVVGSRRLGAVGARMLGSVSRALVHYARNPVAIVHSDGGQPDSGLPVLLGIDGSPASEAATAFAFEEASHRGVDLVSLHAWSDVAVVDYESEWGQQYYEQEGGELLAERLAGWQERYPDVHVWREVFCDRPAHWLIEKSRQSQLVVLGSRGRGGFARLLLGSVSTEVAESSAAPVVVVRGTATD
ncbi:universal stress protein [Mycolicibacterium moriokaense]|nr:universal stress protein [Mycolicibacterium moriokaense]